MLWGKYDGDAAVALFDPVKNVIKNCDSWLAEMLCLFSPIFSASTVTLFLKQ